MGVLDYILILAVGFWLAAAVFSVRKRKRNGCLGCSGCCADCGKDSKFKNTENKY